MAVITIRIPEALLARLPKEGRSAWFREAAEEKLARGATPEAKLVKAVRPRLERMTKGEIGQAIERTEAVLAESVVREAWPASRLCGWHKKSYCEDPRCVRERAGGGADAAE